MIPPPRSSKISTRNFIVVFLGILCILVPVRKKGLGLSVVGELLPKRHRLKAKVLQHNLVSSIQKSKHCRNSHSICAEDRYIIQWKGDGVEGYTSPFRHMEFQNAFAASSNRTNAIKFQDLDVNPSNEKQLLQLLRIEHAAADDDNDDDGGTNSIASRIYLAEASQRCASVRSIYHVLACGDSLEACGDEAASNFKISTFSSGSWCIRVKNLNSSMRSLEESTVLSSMSGFFQLLDGRVDLTHPQNLFHVWQGLSGNANDKLSPFLLTRQIATGFDLSFYKPNTRECVTSTPLDPIAAFIMVNAGRVSRDVHVLDPYAGSGSVLLAASAVAHNVVTIGIDRDETIHFPSIIKDFHHRSLTPPSGLIRGDFRNASIRQQAKKSALSATLSLSSESSSAFQGFDAIITDPPYGIRERLDSDPLLDLFRIIALENENDVRCTMQTQQHKGRFINRCRE